MARARKPRPRPLEQVEPGDAFALPLEDGRWGVCRVVRKSSDPLAVLVAASAWLGDAPPTDLTDPLLTTTLVLTHHSWNSTPHIHWVTDPVPVDVVPLGKLPLRAGEAPGNAFGWGGWESHRMQPLLQWRWDHEREAVLAEDERERQQKQAAEEEARFGYRPLPPALEELRKQKVYAGADYPSPEEIRLSRRIIRDAIDELIALGPDGDEVEKLDVFRRAVERFNETEFIDTVERDYLCELFDNIAESAGLTDYDVTAWRDW
jgi:hypothetical protein